MSTKITFEEAVPAIKKGQYYRYKQGGGIFIVNEDLKLVSLITGNIGKPSGQFERIRGTITIEVV